MYTIYSKPNCQHCDTAKKLMNTLNLSFEERILDVGQIKEDGKKYFTIDQLKSLVPSAKTVPQIFKDDVLIGGFNAFEASVR